MRWLLLVWWGWLGSYWQQANIHTYSSWIAWIIVAGFLWVSFHHRDTSLKVFIMYLICSIGLGYLLGLGMAVYLA